jgi:hypothetical protein
MRLSAVAAAVGFRALVANPELAGQPDDPGAVSAQEALAAARADGMTLGEVNRDIDQELLPNFGQSRTFNDSEGSPNPHNDNGKGNDW